MVAARWRENRPEAPDLFYREVADAVTRLESAAATIGAPYITASGRRMRRLLLAETEQHVYFSIDSARSEVIVHTIWGARRGRGPRL
jgi:hypothetical protein